MAANTSPIFTMTPNVGTVSITTATGLTASNGTSSGTSPSLMFKVFTAGANGSYLDKVRFYCVASTPTSSVATTLRVFLSTVSSPGATVGGTDTFLIGEISVPSISAAGASSATNYYDVNLNMTIPTGKYVHVSQHVVQTTNQNWAAIAIGGDY